MSTKNVEHTAGPWEYDEEGGFIWTAGDPYGHDRMMVGMVRGWGHLAGTGACNFSEEKAIAIQHANGRLQAAAPELEAALWKCREELLSIHLQYGDEANARAHSDALVAADAALAKVRA